MCFTQQVHYFILRKQHFNARSTRRTKTRRGTKHHPLDGLVLHLDFTNNLEPHALVFAPSTTTTKIKPKNQSIHKPRNNCNFDHD